MVQINSQPLSPADQKPKDCTQKRDQYYDQNPNQLVIAIGKVADDHVVNGECIDCQADYPKSKHNQE